MDTCPYCPNPIPTRDDVDELCEPESRERRAKLGALARGAKTCWSPECQRQLARDRNKILRESQVRLAREYACQVCGSTITVPPGTMGGRRSLCGYCRTFGTSVATARLRTSGEEQYMCPCGKAFTRPLTRGQRPRWCPECAAGRGWRKENPTVVAKHRRKSEYLRRARETAPEADVIDPVEIYERDRWRCGVCHKRVRKDLRYPHPMSPSLDHVVPLAEGGSHTRANVRLAHLRCNVSRGARGGGEQLLLIG